MAGPSGATARLALPYPVPSDTADVPRDVQALATSLDTNGTIYLEGTLAARPAAGTKGRFYWATDKTVLYYDTGTAWEPTAHQTDGNMLAQLAAANQVRMGQIANGFPGLEFGSAADTNLYRSGADLLTTDDRFHILRNGAGTAFSIRDAAAGTQSVLAITNGGVLSWGDGAVAADTNLYRSAANTLKTDDALEVAGAAQVNGSLESLSSVYVGSNLYLQAAGGGIVVRNGTNPSTVFLYARPVSKTVDQFMIDAAGKHYWGDGTATVDTNLYRSAANKLTTDDALDVVGALTKSGDAVVTTNTATGLRVAYGTATLVFSASTFSAEVTITHNLGVLPSQIQLTLDMGSASGTIFIAHTIASKNTTTTAVIMGRCATSASTSISCYWMAVAP